jgi:hypothetical protein
MLVAHGWAINGGVLHAVEDLEPHELDAALVGYRYFGLSAAADLLDEFRARLTEGLDEDALERLVQDADRRYGDLAADRLLFDAFEQKYVQRPEDFAALTEEDHQEPEWMQRVRREMRASGWSPEANS